MPREGLTMTPSTTRRWFLGMLLGLPIASPPFPSLAQPLPKVTVTKDPNCLLRRLGGAPAFVRLHG